MTDGCVDVFKIVSGTGIKTKMNHFVKMIDYPIWIIEIMK